MLLFGHRHHAHKLDVDERVRCALLSDRTGEIHHISLQRCLQATSINTVSKKGICATTLHPYLQCPHPDANNACISGPHINPHARTHSASRAPSPSSPTMPPGPYVASISLFLSSCQNSTTSSFQPKEAALALTPTELHLTHSSTQRHAHPNRHLSAKSPGKTAQPLHYPVQSRPSPSIHPPTRPRSSDYVTPPSQL